MVACCHREEAVISRRLLSPGSAGPAAERAPSPCVLGGSSVPASARPPAPREKGARAQSRRCPGRPPSGSRTKPFSSLPFSFSRPFSAPFPPSFTFFFFPYFSYPSSPPPFPLFLFLPPIFLLLLLPRILAPLPYLFFPPISSLSSLHTPIPRILPLPPRLPLFFTSSPFLISLPPHPPPPFAVSSRIPSLARATSTR